MTQEVSGCQKTVDAWEPRADAALDLKTDKKENKVIQGFQKQQAANLLVKESLARELAELELPASVIHQILNIEDELPF